MVNETLAARMVELCKSLNEVQQAQHAANGFTHPADFVHFQDKGSKYLYVDVGGSGAWMVEKATGEIFNIMGYGKVDKNKKAKSDIGNVWTVDPARMFAMRWNYLR